MIFEPRYFCIPRSVFPIPPALGLFAEPVPVVLAEGDGEHNYSHGWSAGGRHQVYQYLQPD